MANLRRMKPALGTFVGIEVRGAERDVLLSATDRAFEEILRIHSLMSFHEATSEVSLLNREAAHRAVQVDGRTYAVLKAAQALSRDSDGMFDVTVAPRLMEWNLLPRAQHAVARRSGDWRDIALLPDSSIRFARPVQIDLGGIAKGYAVDRAVEVLRAAGATSGVVNAGGDLRVFGDEPQLIHVRHPADPQQLVALGTIANEAVATSAPYFSRARVAGREVSHFVNPKSGASFVAAESVSVIAPRCMDADALTKVVLLSPEIAEKALAARAARVFRLSASSASGTDAA